MSKKPGSSIEQLLEMDLGSSCLPTCFRICTNSEMMVQIDIKTGSITYGEHYTPDKAAQAFWEAIAAYDPHRRENIMLKQENKKLKKLLHDLKMAYVGDCDTLEDRLDRVIPEVDKVLEEKE